KEEPMHDWQSLSHVRWDCKYHVVIMACAPRTGPPEMGVPRYTVPRRDPCGSDGPPRKWRACSRSWPGTWPRGSRAPGRTWGGPRDHVLQAGTGNPYWSILLQNCDHRSGVYVRHRTLNTAAAPGSFHFIPDPHNRCVTRTLQAASVTPLPIGIFD